MFFLATGKAHQSERSLSSLSRTLSRMKTKEQKHQGNVNLKEQQSATDPNTMSVSPTNLQGITAVAVVDYRADWSFASSGVISVYRVDPIYSPQQVNGNMPQEAGKVQMGDPERSPRNHTCSISTVKCTSGRSQEPGMSPTPRSVFRPLRRGNLVQ